MPVLYFYRFENQKNGKPVKKVLPVFFYFLSEVTGKKMASAEACALAGTGWGVPLVTARPNLPTTRPSLSTARRDDFKKLPLVIHRNRSGDRFFSRGKKVKLIIKK